MSRRQSACIASAAWLSLLWPGGLVPQAAVGPRNGGMPREEVEVREGVASQIGRYHPGPIEPTSARFAVYTERHLFQARVPSNWHVLPDGDSVVFAPRGGYGPAGGEVVFTHGVEIGLAPRGGDDLADATDALIDLLSSDSPQLRRLSDLGRCSLANQPAVRAVVSSVSEVTGQEERMEIVTTLLGDGRLFYALVVAPRDAFASYEPTFRRVLASIAIIE